MSVLEDPSETLGWGFVKKLMLGKCVERRITFVESLLNCFTAGI
jgi:hypothetical protein